MESGKLAMSSGGVAKNRDPSHILPTTPHPTPWSCHLLQGPGLRRKVPKTPIQATPQLARKAARAWLRLQEVGEEDRLGAKRGRGPRRA